jgi:hypothetical protein
MKSARISISVSPEWCARVKAQAKSRQTSVGRYIEEHMKESEETMNEEVKPYPIEEVLEEARQARIERKKGLLPTFHTAEEVLEFLHNDHV